MWRRLTSHSAGRRVEDQRQRFQRTLHSRVGDSLEGEYEVNHTRQLALVRWDASGVTYRFACTQHAPRNATCHRPVCPWRVLLHTNSWHCVDREGWLP